jgi:hypothetical protein
MADQELLGLGDVLTVTADLTDTSGRASPSKSADRDVLHLRVDPRRLPDPGPTRPGGQATIPTNTTAAFDTGAVIGVMNAGTAGSFTIGTAAGVTLNAQSAGTTRPRPARIGHSRETRDQHLAALPKG